MQLNYGSVEFLGPYVPLVSALAMALTALAFGWLLLWRLRSRGPLHPSTLADAAFTAVLLFTTTSRVISPQYLLWLVGLAAVCLAFRRSPMARPAQLVLVATGVTLLEFPIWFSHVVAERLAGRAAAGRAQRPAGGRVTARLPSAVALDLPDPHDPPVPRSPPAADRAVHHLLSFDVRRREPGQGRALDGRGQRQAQTDAGQAQSQQAVGERQLESHAASGDPRQERARAAALEHPAQRDEAGEQHQVRAEAAQIQRARRAATSPRAPNAAMIQGARAEQHEERGDPTAPRDRSAARPTAAPLVPPRAEQARGVDRGGLADE